MFDWSIARNKTTLRTVFSILCTQTYMQMYCRSLLYQIYIIIIKINDDVIGHKFSTVMGYGYNL